MFDLAPDSEYLIGTSAELNLAQLQIVLNWMIIEGVDVIVNAQPMVWTTVGDSANPIVTLGEVAHVRDAVDAGVTWINAAGNVGQETWLTRGLTIPKATISTTTLPAKSAIRSRLRKNPTATQRRSDGTASGATQTPIWM